MRTNRAGRDPHGGGDRRVIQAGPVPQHERLSLPWGQPVERRDDLAVIFTEHRELLGGGGGWVSRWLPPPGHRCAAMGRPAQVHHSGAQVRGRTVRIAQQQSPSVQPDERLRRHVLGIRGAEKNREPHQRRIMQPEHVLDRHAARCLAARPVALEEILHNR